MKSFFETNQLLVGIIIGSIIVGTFAYLTNQPGEAGAVTQNDQNTQEQNSKNQEENNFYDAAKNYPRGSLDIPAQWFMMESFFEEIGWEKMMFIFGYADNAEVCEHLVEVAKEESPTRNFKCQSAN